MGEPEELRSHHSECAASARAAPSASGTSGVVSGCRWCAGAWGGGARALADAAAATHVSLTPRVLDDRVEVGDDHRIGVDLLDGCCREHVLVLDLLAWQHARGEV